MDKNFEEFICRCEEVTRQEIEYSIEHGATTMNSVKRRTRAGMGFCQGKTCRRGIAKIISEKTGQPLAEVAPSTYRAPVRPVNIQTMVGDYKDDD